MNNEIDYEILNFTQLLHSFSICTQLPVSICWKLKLLSLSLEFQNCLALPRSHKFCFTNCAKIFLWVSIFLSSFIRLYILILLSVVNKSWTSVVKQVNQMLCSKWFEILKLSGSYALLKPTGIIRIHLLSFQLDSMYYNVTLINLKYISRFYRWYYSLPY